MKNFLLFTVFTLQFSALFAAEGFLDLSQKNEKKAGKHQILRKEIDIEKFLPDENEKAVPLDALVQIQFGKAISQFDPTGVSIRDENFAVVTGVSGNPVDSTLTISHDDFEHGRTYTVSIAEGAINDTEDNANEAISWSFTTILPAPAIKSSAPANNATNVSISDSITVTFNQAVFRKDTKLARIVESETEEIAITSMELVDSSLVIKHGGLKNNVLYTVQIPDSVVANADSVRNVALTISFTSVPILLDAVDAIPDSFAEQVPVNTPIEMKFNVSIQAIDLLGVEIKTAGGSSVAGSSVSVRDSSVVFTNPGLAHGTNYKVTIPAGAIRGTGTDPNELLFWSFTTIKSAPEIASTLPINNASNVSISDSITVKFNQAVFRKGTKLARIIDAETQEVTVTSMGLVDSTLVIKHGGLKNNVSYTVQIPDSVVANSDSLRNVAAEFSFTTIKASASVKSKTPEENAKMVALDAPIQVKFDGSISEVDFSGVIVEGIGNDALSGVSARISDSTLTIAHTDFEHGITYTVKVPAGTVKDENDAENELISWRFRSILAAPEIATTSPINNATSVSISDSITVKFNQAVFRKGTKLARILGPGSDEVAVTTMSLIDSSLVIKHGGLKNNVLYTVQIPDSVVANADSVRNVATEFSFRTIPAPFGVKTRTPSINATGVALNAPVRLTFNEPITLNSAAGIVIRNSANQAVTGISVTVSDSTLNIAHANFQNGRVYTVTVPANAVKNASNVNSSIQIWSFTTILTAPQFVSSIPVNNSSGANAKDSVRVKFNQKVFKSGNKPIRFVDNAASEILSTSLSTNDSTLTIRHNGLRNNVLYTVHIPDSLVANSDSVRNVATTFRFTTAPAVLEVVASKPSSNAQKVPVNTPIELKFNVPIETINLTGVEIKTAAGASVPGSSVSARDSSIVIFNPGLLNATQYLVTVPAGVIRASGSNPNVAVSWSFTTIKATPTIASSSPANNATGISLSAPLQITFSQSITAVELDSVTLRNAAGSLVSGINTQLTDSILTVTHPNFSLFSVYTLRIGKGTIKNSDDVLNEAEEIRFTTLSNGPSVTSAFPISGSSKIAISTPIRLKFNKAIFSFLSSAVSIRDSLNNAIGSINGFIADSTLTLTHANFRNDMKYTVSIAAGTVQSSDGQPSMPFVFSFKTIKAVPVANRLLPLNNAQKVSVVSPIQVVFNHIVSASRVGKISVKTVRGEVARINKVEVIDSTLTIYADTLLFGSRYLVSIPDSAIANADSVYNFPIDWVFTTVKAAPKSIQQTPANGSTGLSRTVVLSALFDQTISIADSTKITLRDSSGGIVSGTRAKVENSDNLVVQVPELAFLTVYTVSVADSAVKNEDDQMNRAFSWNFTTVIQPPLPVDLVSPANMDPLVPVNTRFNWNRAARATSYSWQISKTIDFSSILEQAVGLTDTTIGLLVNLNPLEKYYWRVKAGNPGGESDWSQVRVFTTKAPPPNVLYPAKDATNTSVSPVFSWSSEYKTVQFGFELSINADFSTVVIDSVTSNFKLELQSLASNTVYFWRVRIDDPLGRSEWTATRTFTTRQSPQVAEAAEVQRIFSFGETSTGTVTPSRADFKLISLPGTDTLKVDAIFNDTYQDKWRAFLEPGDVSADYVEYTAADARFTFKPGNGFWILGSKEFTASRAFTPVELRKNDTYAIPLQSGWNIIGNPFQRSIDWSVVKYLNRISGDAFGFERQFIPAVMLEPFTGYYYFNDPATPKDSLFLSYTSAAERGIPADSLTRNATVAVPKIVLTAAFTQSLRASVEMIFESEQTSGREKEFSGVYPNWAMSAYGMQLIAGPTLSNGYFRSVVTPKSSDEPYEIELKAPVGTSITWMAEAKHLSGERFYLLVNPVTKQHHFAKEGDPISIRITEPNTRFALHIGSEQQLLKVQQQLQPEHIELSQNYPNPFNPKTIIRYALNEETAVSLDVFDLTGRKVASLVQGRKAAGWHVAEFDASRLASGIYLYRLQTDKVTRIQKMTLLK